MEISPILLLRMLAAFLILGMGLGVLHDCHRLIRVLLGIRYGGRHIEHLYALRLPILQRPLAAPKETKARKVILFAVMLIQDILLFATAGAGTAILLYYFNQGRFRLLSIFALVVGFLLYYFTVGKLVMLFSEGIIFFLRAAVSIFFAFLFRPIGIFFGFFRKNAKKICKKFKNHIAKKRKWVYNKIKIEQIMQQAEHGFLNKDV